MADTPVEGVPRHVTSWLHTLPEQVPLMSKKRTTDRGEKRVTLWNPTEKRKLSGNAAPFEGNVESYLIRHPVWEVFTNQDDSNAQRKCNKRRRPHGRPEPFPANPDFDECILHIQGPAMPPSKPSTDTQLHQQAALHGMYSMGNHIGDHPLSSYVDPRSSIEAALDTNYQMMMEQYRIATMIHVHGSTKQRWPPQTSQPSQQEPPFKAGGARLAPSNESIEEGMISHRKLSALMVDGNTEDQEQRVTLWNPIERRKLSGNAAPLARNVQSYLSRNMDWEIYSNQDISLQHENSSSSNQTTLSTPPQGDVATAPSRSELETEIDTLRATLCNTLKSKDAQIRTLRDTLRLHERNKASIVKPAAVHWPFAASCSSLLAIWEQGAAAALPNQTTLKDGERECSEVQNKVQVKKESKEEKATGQNQGSKGDRDARVSLTIDGGTSEQGELFANATSSEKRGDSFSGSTLQALSYLACHFSGDKSCRRKVGQKQAPEAPSKIEGSKSTESPQGVGAAEPKVVQKLSAQPPVNVREDEHKNSSDRMSVTSLLLPSRKT